MLKCLLLKILSYQSCSLHNEDYILDTDIQIEDIGAAIAKLKQGESAGPDGILSQHLIHTGPLFKVWLKIFNSIIMLGAIPPYLSTAIIIPIYRG